MPHEDLMLQNIPIPGPVSDDQRHRAKMTVCSNAVDTQEAVHLLSMLGLI
jgi:hypothetical protein